eukprot:2400575-Pyramimonas_sp.AAC.1
MPGMADPAAVLLCGLGGASGPRDGGPGGGATVRTILTDCTDGLYCSRAQWWTGRCPGWRTRR